MVRAFIRRVITLLRIMEKRLNLDADAKLRLASAASITQIEESGLFDAEWYAAQCPSLAGRRIQDMIAHYITEGWRYGLDPGPGFDTKSYCQAQPFVERNGVNPLLLHLSRGVLVGSLTHKAAVPERIDHDLTDLDQWPVMAQSVNESALKVDIVVPVHGDRERALACIKSVLDSVDRHFCQVIVINDASPDAVLSDTLRVLAERAVFTLIEHAVKRGDVASVNAGISLHPHRDVLLLKPDTMVYGKWLEKLHHHARSHVRVATVTPFSNSGGINSYPHVNKHNNGLHGTDAATLDRLAGRVNAGLAIEIPACVGFCVYLCRDALDTLGPFNEDASGGGYGAENDFSYRAVKAGWNNVLACDVFVFHHGGVFFGEDVHADRRRRGRAPLPDQIADHRKRIEAYTTADPAKRARDALDLAHVSAFTNARRTVVLISQNCGGGTEVSVAQQARMFTASGCAVLILRPAEESGLLIEPWGRPALSSYSPLPWDEAMTNVEHLFRHWTIAELHIHHTNGYPDPFLKALPPLLRRLEIRSSLWLHDLLTLCPSLGLVHRERGVYCGAPTNTAQCDHCLSQIPEIPISGGIVQWRQRHAAIFQTVDSIIAPDQSVATVVKRLGVARPIRVIPHHHLILAKTEEWPEEHSPRRIAVVGNMAVHKGRALLHSVATCVEQFDLPVRFHHFGSVSHGDSLNNVPTISLGGPYRRDQLSKRLRQSGATLAFFPTQCHETFSFALSEVLVEGLYPVCLDVGAIASRIRELGWGTVLPLEYGDHPARLARFLASLQLPEERRYWQIRPTVIGEYSTIDSDSMQSCP
ncbi:MAG: glycosyltransferase [Magnetococcales bacterium]|nr:glycosyltransferase [Magnetococcales bacterium]